MYVQSVKSCRHRRPSSFSPPPGGQETEAVNGLFASPILSILLKALVLTTYAVRPSRSGHRCSSSSSPPPVLSVEIVKLIISV